MSEFDDTVDEALAEMGRQSRAGEYCPICYASVRANLRDRHLNWHALLAHEAERERLPQVYGGLSVPPGKSNE